MGDEPLVGNDFDTPDMLAKGGRRCGILATAVRGLRLGNPFLDFIPDKRE